MVPTAYLKVFQPLSAFPKVEQDRWERELVDGGALRRYRSVYRQQVLSDGLGFLIPDDVDGADFRTVDGECFVSPWRVRIRVLHSLLALRESPVSELSEELVPEHIARKAARELSKRRRKDRTAVPFVQESSWQVPIRWFLLVQDEERRLVERADGRSTIVYTTSVGKAMRRLARAYDVVLRTELDPLLDMLRDLKGWLGSFERRSILELDYGTLSRFMTWDEMDDDRSARDIHEAIAALSIGEVGRSADLYQGLAGHWAEVRSHENLN